MSQKMKAISRICTSLNGAFWVDYNGVVVIDSIDCYNEGIDSFHVDQVCRELNMIGVETLVGVMEF